MLLCFDCFKFSAIAPPQPLPRSGRGYSGIASDFLKQILILFLVEILTSFLSLSGPSHSGGGVGVGHIFRNGFIHTISKIIHNNYPMVDYFL
jgi:hypothetical protein